MGLGVEKETFDEKDNKGRETREGNKYLLVTRQEEGEGTRRKLPAAACWNLLRCWVPCGERSDVAVEQDGQTSGLTWETREKVLESRVVLEECFTGCATEIGRG